MMNDVIYITDRHECVCVGDHIVTREDYNKFHRLNLNFADLQNEVNKLKGKSKII